jgi:predicted HNH restriction endonuclease
MKWKEFIYQLIVDYCNERGSRTFTLKEFNDENKKAIQKFADTGKLTNTPFDTVRRVLQELRTAELLHFVDNSGTYTLRNVPVLKGEVEDDKIAEVLLASPNKREYLIETYARNKGWVKQAKEIFDLYCLYQKCSNTFIKENGESYIEVHHIIPLCDDGEDGIWNLSVLCAHHHRMAHFADVKTRISIEKFLLKEVGARI